jgi:hypothetical protein
LIALVANILTVIVVSLIQRIVSPSPHARA